MANLPVHGDCDDGERGEVDRKAWRGLDQSAEGLRVAPERPVLGEHVKRGQDHGQAKD